MYLYSLTVVTPVVSGASLWGASAPEPPGAPGRPPPRLPATQIPPPITPTITATEISLPSVVRRAPSSAMAHSSSIHLGWGSALRVRGTAPVALPAARPDPGSLARAARRPRSAPPQAARVRARLALYTPIAIAPCRAVPQ